MNKDHSLLIEYSKIFLRVIKQHLQEDSCSHSILHIAAEADCEASKTACFVGGVD